MGREWELQQDIGRAPALQCNSRRASVARGHLSSDWFHSPLTA